MTYKLGKARKAAVSAGNAVKNAVGRVARRTANKLRGFGRGPLNTFLKRQFIEERIITKKLVLFDSQRNPKNDLLKIRKGTVVAFVERSNYGNSVDHSLAICSGNGILKVTHQLFSDDLYMRTGDPKEIDLKTMGGNFTMWAVDLQNLRRRRRDKKLK
jgi:hypothetical protein